MDLNSIIRKRNVQVGAAAVVLLAVAVSLAVMGASPSGQAGAPGPLIVGNPTAGGEVVSASNDPSSDEARAAAGIDGEATGDAATSDGTSPSDPGTAGTNDVVEQPGATDTSAAMKRVRIMWWNDTEDTPVEGFLVSVGSSSWSPDETADSDVGTLSVSVDKPSTLVIYPDGPGGARIEVSILFQKMMKDDSEQDAIIIEISDTAIRVLGNPVENVDQTFDRF